MVFQINGDLFRPIAWRLVRKPNTLKLYFPDGEVIYARIIGDYDRVVERITGASDIVFLDDDMTGEIFYRHEGK